MTQGRIPCRPREGEEAEAEDRVGGFQRKEAEVGVDRGGVTAGYQVVQVVMNQCLNSHRPEFLPRLFKARAM